MKTTNPYKKQLCKRCKHYLNKIIERRNEVDETIDICNNIRKRLNQFNIVSTSSGRPYYYEWELYGDADLDYYMIPKGTQFSWRSSNSEEIQTFTHPDDIITLNNFDDVAKTLYLDDDSFSLEKRYCVASLSIIEVQQRFGSNIPNDLLGFAQFEKSLYFYRDGNSTHFIGLKCGHFYYIHFGTS